VLYFTIINIKVIYSIIKLTKLYNKLLFYNFYYYIIFIKLILSNNNKESVYLNIKYIITLIN
jgi:hypothetical protein